MDFVGVFFGEGVRSDSIKVLFFFNRSTSFQGYFPCTVKKKKGWILPQNVAVHSDSIIIILLIFLGDAWESTLEHFARRL